MVQGPRAIGMQGVRRPRKLRSEGLRRDCRCRASARGRAHGNRQAMRDWIACSPRAWPRHIATARLTGESASQGAQAREPRATAVQVVA